MKYESLQESIKRHEHYLALRLQLKQGMKVTYSLRHFCIPVSWWEVSILYVSCMTNEDTFCVCIWRFPFYFCKITLYCRGMSRIHTVDICRITYSCRINIHYQSSSYSEALYYQVVCDTPSSFIQFDCASLFFSTLVTSKNIRMGVVHLYLWHVFGTILAFQPTYNEYPLYCQLYR